MERSRAGVRASVSVAESFAGFESTILLGAVTDAVLEIAPEAEGDTVASSVNVAVPPTMRSTLVAMLPVPLAAPHAEPALGVHVHVAFVRSAGSVSVTVAPVTASGPALVTWTVYARLAPGT